MGKKKTISIEGEEITILAQPKTDYISLTDMARNQLQEVVIIKWLSLKSTIEYLGEWEILYNSDFNYTEFGTIKNSAGSNNFVLSVKQWIEPIPSTSTHPSTLIPSTSTHSIPPHNPLLIFCTIKKLKLL